MREESRSAPCSVACRGFYERAVADREGYVGGCRRWEKLHRMGRVERDCRGGASWRWTWIGERWNGWLGLGWLGLKVSSRPRKEIRLRHGALGCATSREKVSFPSSSRRYSVPDAPEGPNNPANTLAALSTTLSHPSPSSPLASCLAPSATTLSNHPFAYRASNSSASCSSSACKGL